MEKVLMGYVKADQVEYDQFGEVKKRLGEIELAIYYDPKSGLVEAQDLMGNVLATSTDVRGLVTPLARKNIDFPVSDIGRLPMVGRVWLPEDVEELKKNLELFSSKGIVSYYDPRLNAMRIKVVRKVDENVYEDLETIYFYDREYIDVTKTRYYIVRNEMGHEEVRMVTAHKFVDLF